MGPFDTRTEAIKAENDLYAAIKSNPYLRDEMICDIVEIPGQQVSAADVATELRNQHD